MHVFEHAARHGRMRTHAGLEATHSAVTVLKSFLPCLVAWHGMAWHGRAEIGKARGRCLRPGGC
jgi:hypothetical protein